MFQSLLLAMLGVPMGARHKVEARIRGRAQLTEGVFQNANRL